jgi:hypothetical protein
VGTLPLAINVHKWTIRARGTSTSWSSRTAVRYTRRTRSSVQSELLPAAALMSKNWVSNKNGRQSAPRNTGHVRCARIPISILSQGLCGRGPGGPVKELSKPHRTSFRRPDDQPSFHFNSPLISILWWALRSTWQKARLPISTSYWFPDCRGRYPRVLGVGVGQCVLVSPPMRRSIQRVVEARGG